MTVGQLIAVLVLLLAVLCIFLPAPDWAAYALIAGLSGAVLFGSVALVRPTSG